LFEWTPRSFVPVAAAAIVAEVERNWLALPSPLFPFVGGMATSWVALGCWILVGLLSGLLSGVLTQLVYACEDGFLKLPIHWMWWPMLGGLVVGNSGLIDPRALSVGYDSIALMLKGRVGPLSALHLLVVKTIIWAVALGYGTSGGVLAPLLIMGGGLGAGPPPAGGEPGVLAVAGGVRNHGRHHAVTADGHLLCRRADR
jgi:chloride channel protein, CIC family